MKPARLVLLVIGAILLAACAGPSSSFLSGRTMTATPATPTQTFCLGRFLIDVPQGAYLDGAGYKYNFARIEPPVLMSQEQFEREVDEREAKLKATKHEKDPSLLRQALRPDANARVLMFWARSYSTAMVNIEGYKWADGVRFKIRDEAGRSKQPEGLASMQDAITRLRPRADTEIPTEPGYCFAGGFIAGGWQPGEEVNISFSFPDYPDASLLVWFYPLRASRRDKPLLERIGGLTGWMANALTHARVLRSGDREVGGFPGQEYLVSGPSSGGPQGQMFTWQTEGGGKLKSPSISIELQTGGRDDKGNPQATRLSDEDAMALWDRILPTFRVRPTGGAPVDKSSDAGPPLRPLGESLVTGRACSQSGWWECADWGGLPGEVQDSRRFFRQGEILPQAMLLGKPNLWRRLKGEPASAHPVTAVWKLVEYGQDQPPANPAADA